VSGYGIVQAIGIAVFASVALFVLFVAFETIRDRVKNRRFVVIYLGTKLNTSDFHNPKKRKETLTDGINGVKEASKKEICVRISVYRKFPDVCAVKVRGQKEAIEKLKSFLTRFGVWHSDS